MDMAQKFPRIAVGAVIKSDGKVLLVKRKNPPAQGLWAIPGGKVRWGETLEQALKREIKEELNIEIRPEKLLKVFEFLPKKGESDFHYVILDYLATIMQGKPEAGDDALECSWLGPKEINELPLTKSTKDLLREVFGLY